MFEIVGFRRVFRCLGWHLGERGLNYHAGVANVLTNAPKAFHEKRTVFHKVFAKDFGTMPMYGFTDAEDSSDDGK